VQRSKFAQGTACLFSPRSGSGVEHSEQRWLSALDFKWRSRDEKNSDRCRCRRDCRRGWWGPAIGAFAVGAIVGSAFARPYYGGYFGGYYPSYSSYPAYGYSYPSYGYSYAPAYYGYAYAPRPYYSCWRYGYRVC
jgi:hypothetical protein